MQTKMKNHYDYLFNVQFGKLELQILNELPKSLRAEVLMMNMSLCKEHPFVKDDDDEFFLGGERAKYLLQYSFSLTKNILAQSSLKSSSHGCTPPTKLWCAATPRSTAFFWSDSAR